MMADWTPEASEYFEGYLKQVHALATSSGDDADEITSGLRDHITTKVEQEAGLLITVGALRKILAAVGSPEAIVEDAPALLEQTRVREETKRSDSVESPRARTVPPVIERVVIRETGTRSRNVLRWVVIAAILVVMTPIVLSMLGIVVALILPAFGRSREAAQRTQCANNLKQIGLAIERYEDDHPDTIPRTMSDLYPYVKDAEVFACPGAQKENREPRELDQWASYEFNPAWSENNGLPIIQEKSLTNHRPNGINVVYNNGRVEFVKHEDLVEWIE